MAKGGEGEGKLGGYRGFTDTAFAGEDLVGGVSYCSSWYKGRWGIRGRYSELLEATCLREYVESKDAESRFTFLAVVKSFGDEQSSLTMMAGSSDILTAYVFHGSSHQVGLVQPQHLHFRQAKESPHKLQLRAPHDLSHSFLGSRPDLQLPSSSSATLNTNNFATMLLGWAAFGNLPTPRVTRALCRNISLSSPTKYLSFLGAML